MTIKIQITTTITITTIAIKGRPGRLEGLPKDNTVISISVMSYYEYNYRRITGGTKDYLGGSERHPAARPVLCMLLVSLFVALLLVSLSLLVSLLSLLSSVLLLLLFSIISLMIIINIIIIIIIIIIIMFINIMFIIIIC